MYWNERYSNRIMYVPDLGSSELILRRIDENSASWVVTDDAEPVSAALHLKPGVWQQVGQMSRHPVTYAYRRVR